MKLLILTQKIDINHPILGFFHRWVEEFSKHCEKITVITLGVGEHYLPKNVEVYSLGKEMLDVNSQFSIVRKIKYIFNFYQYVWKLHRNYDIVFVHMNQEYVLLGWQLWRILNKKIWLWRNHPKGGVLTNLAVWLADRVFCTSKYSYTAKFKKTEIMPVGIDKDFFRRKLEIQKIPNSILFLGRISPIKKPDLFIEVLNLLNKENIDFQALVVGEPLLKDIKYYENIKLKTKEYGLENKIKFMKAVKHNETVDLYNKYELYVNLTPTGSMDKTIFEAMACECLILTSNKSLDDMIDNAFAVNDNKASLIAVRIKDILSLNQQEKIVAGQKLSNFVIENHSLKLLTNRLF